MKFAGYCTVPATREIAMVLSSRGCLSTSRTSLGNSVSSSKNKIPLCARDTSHGVSCCPHHTIATFDAVWCTCLNGRCVMSGRSLSNFPMIE